VEGKDVKTEGKKGVVEGKNGTGGRTGGRSSFHQKIPMKRAIFEESGRWKE
jgi:hypothetical protein